MTHLILIAVLLAQIPVRPSEGGTITGVLRNEEGKPAIGIRIAAIAKPEAAAAEAAAIATMSSIGETDEEGRFRLEGVPPGRYYIAAGRVDFPTFYPGTQSISNGTTIEVEAGGAITLTEFAMQDESMRPPTAAEVVYRDLPVRIRVENGARLPVYSPAGQTLLWLTRSDNTKVALPMTGTSLRVPVPSAAVAGEFRATITNLPEGYVIKSMMFGSINATSSPFKIAAAPTPAPLLSVELTTIPASRSSNQGVRVTGRVPGGAPIYLSGKAATLYSDGTFEFRDVPPGRHAVAVPDGPKSSHTLGASIVVGDRDLEAIELVDTPVLPFAPRAPAEPRPAGTRAPGSVVPLASLRGRVVEENSSRPIGGGTATLTSFTSASFPISEAGEFLIPRLFPGSYNLQIQIPGRTPLSRKVTIGDEDVNIELALGAM